MLVEAGVMAVRTGSLVTVTLDRPHNHNAMGPGTWAALAAVGASIGDDVRVVVLEATGPSFSSGLDRRLFNGEASEDDHPFLDLFTASAVEFDQLAARFQQGFAWLQDPRFISIAAVHGYSIGAGFQLALACDIRIAADDVKFCMREAALGLVPDLTGTKNLVQAVGYARALEWTASARIIEAEEALATGLVSKVVSLPHLAQTVGALVDDLSAPPHGAVSAAKKLLLSAGEASFEQQRAAERAAQFARFATLAAPR